MFSDEASHNSYQVEHCLLEQNYGLGLGMRTKIDFTTFDLPRVLFRVLDGQL